MADMLNYNDFLDVYMSIEGKEVWIDFINEFGIVVDFDFFLQSLYVELDDGETIITSLDSITKIEEIDYLDEFLKINQLKVLIDTSLDELDEKMFMFYSEKLIELKNTIRSGGGR